MGCTIWPYDAVYMDMHITNRVFGWRLWTTALSVSYATHTVLSLCLHCVYECELVIDIAAKASVCVREYSLKILLSFFFIIFHLLFLRVSTIRCRYNRCMLLNRVVNPLHPLSPLLSSFPEIDSIFCPKCLCLVHQICKHFQFSISFKWLWQIQLLLLLCVMMLYICTKRKRNIVEYAIHFYCCCHLC